MHQIFVLSLPLALSQIDPFAVLMGPQVERGDTKWLIMSEMDITKWKQAGRGRVNLVSQRNRVRIKSDGVRGLSKEHPALGLVSNLPSCES